MKNYKALQNGTDIRGVALKIEGGKDVNLTKEACRDLALAFADYLSAHYHKNEITVAVGRDSRVTGEAIAAVVCESLQQAGVKVFDFGMATTPSMFMATQFAVPDADGAVMITASHLPMERNGLKFFTREGGLESSDIKALIDAAETLPPDFALTAEKKPAERYDFMKDYAAHLRQLICSGLNAAEEDKPLTGLHVAVDAGNGAGGFYVSGVLEPLGADCSGSQFLEPDGSFPNHIPNPENAQAMESISKAVLSSGADLGLIFDTDVDRAAAVASTGKEIARNGIVALAAAIACMDHPGTTIVTDSITSTQLHAFLTEKLGCRHLRFKRGYKNVIDKGMALNAEGTDCQLAIETSGHAAMKDNYFLDDGAYLATRIVVEAAKLKRQGKHIEDMLEGLADPLEAIEVRFHVLAPDFADYAQSVLDHIAAEAPKMEGWSLELPNYEGVRVNVPDGWFLIRKSLHDPVIPLNVESDRAGGTAETLAQIREILKPFTQLS